MKILVDDSISSVSARDLGFYLGDSSHHKPENALNDIPSVEWVAGYPNQASPVSISSIGRYFIEVDFKIFGRGALGAFYFGKFTADRLSMTIQHNIDMDRVPANDINEQFAEPSAETASYPFANHGSFDPIQIPIRVYNTVSDFVRGKFVRYNDYFRTLEEVNFQAFELQDPSRSATDMIPSPIDITDRSLDTPNKEVKPLSYIARDYEIKLKFVMENQNTLQTDQLAFLVEESKKIDGFTEEIDGVTYEYVELIGRFYDKDAPAGEFIGYDNKFSFIENLDIGSYVIGSTANNTDSNGNLLPMDLFQLIRIKGDGTTAKSITLLSRKSVSESSLNPINTISEPNRSGILIYSIMRSLRLGLVRCGFYEKFNNAQVGLSKKYKDYSVRTELVNGGHQYINRNVSKTYSGNLIMDRTRVIKFLKFAEKQKARPFPVEILSDMPDESPTMMFCVFDSLPEESMSYRSGIARDISFNLKQIQ